MKDDETRNDEAPAPKIAKRIVVVDDHPMMREAIAETLNDEPGCEVCGRAGDIIEALAVIEREQPDLLVVDMSLDDGDGLDVVRQMSGRCPTTRALVFSMHEESLYARRAIEAGAHGFLNKQAPPGQLIQAARTVLAGGMHLSDEAARHMPNPPSDGGQPWGT